jgi:hypothetical protein
MGVHVTHHAIDRYIERVEPTDRISARERILGAQRGIAAAAAIGAHIVKLSNRARPVIAGVHDVRVVTVLGPEQHLTGRQTLAPLCCGACGRRRTHPAAKACTRADCGLVQGKGRE